MILSEMILSKFFRVEEMRGWPMIGSETRAWRREHGELERLSEQPKRIFPRVSRLHAPRFFLSDRPMKRLGDPFNCPALVRLFQKILR